MTTTWERMWECPTPQYSVQKMSYEPGSYCREPQMGRHAGHAVLLDSEGGDEEAVDDVLGGQEELHRLADGHTQHVALPAVFVLEEPGPLARDHGNGMASFGRVADVIEIHPAEVET